MIILGDVWFARFPLEEDNSKYISRPVIVLDAERLEVMVVKVTKTAPRFADKYDVPIIYWQYANLRFQSTARVSKTLLLDHSQFDFKIGSLHPTDLLSIREVFKQYITENY